MSSTQELKEKSTGELTMTAKGGAWRDARKKAFRKLVEKINLPGSRPDQAPEKLARKQISSQNILMEAISEVTGDASDMGTKEHGSWMISCPVLNIESINENKIIFKFNITTKPEVKLGAHRGSDITKETVKVSDTDVERKITRLQERFVDLIVKEEDKVEDGDTATVDFEDFKEGAALKGGKGKAYPLVIGSGNFIPGFEEQILGMGVGGTKGINITFPEGYQAEELVSQPAVFKVAVHETKSKIFPKADDELVKRAEVGGVETLETFEEYSRKNLREGKKDQAEQRSENEIPTAAIKNTEAEIPQVMIEEEADSLVHDSEQRLRSQGFGLEQFKQMTGQTDETIREEMGEDAFSRVKMRSAPEAITTGEKIRISKENVNNGLGSITDMYQMPVKQVKQLTSNDMVPYDLRIRKVLKPAKEAADK